MFLLRADLALVLEPAESGDERPVTIGMVQGQAFILSEPVHIGISV